jgi:cell division protein FtsW (lipid II flippase)
MVFFQSLLFIAIASAFPLSMMWSAGAFVGQKKPNPFVVQVIRYGISGLIFYVATGAAFYTFKKYNDEWWWFLMAAAIAGAGMCGIIGVNTYDGERNAQDGTVKK